MIPERGWGEYGKTDKWRTDYVQPFRDTKITTLQNHHSKGNGQGLKIPKFNLIRV